MTGQAESIKISSLQERYGLDSRQAVYGRINGLDLQPIARGKISLEQLEILDRLDKHIRAGGAITDFPIQPEVQLPTLDKLDNTVDIEPDQATTINVMAQLIEKMMSYTLAHQTSPLTSYEELEKAIKFEWVLPTSLVKQLTGATPRTTKDNVFFKWGSFAFKKEGKIGREAGWKVQRASFATLDLKQLPAC